jgi:hypothetical protein
MSDIAVPTNETDAPILAGDGITTPGWAKIDELEQVMAQAEPLDCPVTHRFTPGLYIREIFMPAGAVITSKIHNTQHPYVVTKGRVSVWIEDTGWVLIEAPYTGITNPGTRRVLLVHEDTVWTTFHPTTKTTVAEIEQDIIMPRTEHLEGIPGAARHAIASLFKGKGVIE